MSATSIVLLLIVIISIVLSVFVTIYESRGRRDIISDIRSRGMVMEYTVYLSEGTGIYVCLINGEPCIINGADIHPIAPKDRFVFKKSTDLDEGQ